MSLIQFCCDVSYTDGDDDDDDDDDDDCFHFTNTLCLRAACKQMLAERESFSVDCIGSDTRYATCEYIQSEIGFVTTLKLPYAELSEWVKCGGDRPRL